MAPPPPPGPRPTRSAPQPWPSANAYSQALQNPSTAFTDPLLRGATTARDRLGMPLVMSGNFAYVFKLALADGGARAVKCFRRALGDRGPRFQAIDEHLERLALEDIAHFEYEAEGVLVAGERYPTLVMEWVAGPTLDVYVGELLKTADPPAALRDLRAQWVQLVAKLEEAGIAHGDLQHGNVIVTPAGMRLVDLDGMFVPALRGRGAPDEVGHRHYQHPARTVADFDESLDRFAGIVIHTSLVALAADPSLWREFHDDNLLFTRADFEQPHASRLFSRIARLGGDAARLAGVLMQACAGPMRDVPPLTRLVDVPRSKLPLWIRQPVVPTVEQRTREASAGDVAPASPQQPAPAGRAAAPPFAQPPFAQPPAAPWPPPTSSQPPVTWAQATGPVQPPSPWPSAPPSPQLSSQPSSQPRGRWGRPRLQGAASTAGAPSPQGWPPDEPPSLFTVARIAAVLTLLGISATRVWWPPLANVVETIGVDRLSSFHPVGVFLAYAAIVSGATYAVSRVFRSDGSIRLPRLPAMLRRRRAAVHPAVGYVASSLLCVFHRHDCPFVGQIGVRNRIWMLHAYEAKAGGFQPCLLCRP